jgi:16S rRNA (adenine1518-N6/adenine1519-N6)-dimethyltransferase
VIEILPLAGPAFPARLADLERVTQAAFGQRRKMLRQSLRSLGGNTEALMAEAEITPTAPTGSWRPRMRLRPRRFASKSAWSAIRMRSSAPAPSPGISIATPPLMVTVPAG